ncbi:MAG: hypothetical protein ABJP45_19330 [Cyclobacteriaceae bacterium]
MLRFFRINDPYRLIFIFLILIGIRLVQTSFIEGQFLLELKWLLLGEWLDKGFKMYQEAYDYTGPLAAVIYKYLDFLFGRSPLTHHVFSSLLIIFQAGLFNRILLKNKAFDENNYLPAFFYVIATLSIPDFMALSPQLISMTFILQALSSVLRRIDNQATDQLFLNSGLFVGVATMIYLPSFVFFFVFLVSLIIFSSAIARRLLMYLFGFGLIIGMSALYFFWRGDLYFFAQYFFVQGLFLDGDFLLSFGDILTISSFFIAVFVITVGKSLTTARLTNFQQRVQQVIWLMFVGGICCYFLTNKKTGIELIFLVPLIAYFLTHYFMMIRKRFFKAIMPGVFVLGLLGFNAYAYSNLLDALVVSELPTGEANIMVLDENFGYYLNKEAGSPCFSRSICQQAFEGLEYYEASSSIYKLIDNANPDLIIDDLGVAPDIFYRFPLLEKMYAKRGLKTYYRISN